MRQVYKGEIEEKNQAASSNSTGIIMYERHQFVNFLYAKIFYFLRKRQIAAQLVLCNTLVFLKISYKSMSKLCVVLDTGCLFFYKVHKMRQRFS